MSISWLQYLVLFILFDVFAGVISYRFTLFTILLGTSLIIASIPIGISIYRGRIDIFEPIIFKSVFMYMILIAIADRFYFSNSYQRYSEWIEFSFHDGYLLILVLYTTLFVSILIGYYLRTELPAYTKGVFNSIGKPQTNKVKRLSYTYMLIGLGAYIILIGNALHWDPLYLFTTSEPRSQIFAGSSNSLLRLITQALYIGFFLHIAVLIAKSQNVRLRDFIGIGIIITLFALLGGRGHTIKILLVTCIFLYYIWIKELIHIDRQYIKFIDPTDQKLIKIGVFPLLGLPVAILILSSRYMRRSYTLIESISEIDFVRLLTFGINNEKFEYFLVLVSTDEIEYSYGSRFLRVPLNFIPRTIWPDKPVLNVESEIRRLILPDAAGGRAIGEIGSYYAEFSYLGVIILGIIYGRMLRITYEFLIDNSKSPFAILVYAVILVPLVTSGLTNNALWTITTDLLWLSPPLFLLINQNE